MSDWTERAACRNLSLGDNRERLSVFYPSPAGRSKKSDADYKAAVTFACSICATCPVVIECRTEAVKCGDHEGIQGGMTGSQRKRWARHNGIRQGARLLAMEGRPNTGWQREWREGGQLAVSQ